MTCKNFFFNKTDQELKDYWVEFLKFQSHGFVHPTNLLYPILLKYGELLKNPISTFERDYLTECARRYSESK